VRFFGSISSSYLCEGVGSSNILFHVMLFGTLQWVRRVWMFKIFYINFMTVEE